MSRRYHGRYNVPITVSRRHFLRTASGGLLAIPVLRSLLTAEEARAAVAPKRFLAITMRNGFHPAFMYPEYPRITTSKITANGLDAHVMPFASLGADPVSYLLGTEFNSLKNSMLLLRGFETLCPNLDHQGDFFLSGMSGTSMPAAGNRYPSIDQHIKPVIYAGATVPPKADVLCMQVSWDNGRESSSFSIGAGGAQANTRSFSEPSAVWQQLFGDFGPIGTASAQKDQLVADKVVDHYRAVIANPRLAADDKLKLETHLARVTERQAAIQAGLTGSAQCVPPLRPTVNFSQQADKVRETLAAYVDLIVAAFECDLTRMVILEIDPDVLWRPIAPYLTGYHDESHNVDTRSNLVKYSDITKDQLKTVASLWQKLQAATDVDGNSLLYNTLSLVTKELGDYGGGGRSGNMARDRVEYAGTIANPNTDHHHLGHGMFALIGGNLGGLLKTGKYIDYTGDVYSPNNRWKPMVGPSYAELLISTMVAFGVTPGSWEIGNTRGYGDNREAMYNTSNPTICPKSTDRRSILPGWT